MPDYIIALIIGYAIDLLLGDPEWLLHPVVLIGRDGDEAITVYEVAEAAYSFHYEFVCGIARRIPRIYVRGGRIVKQNLYLNI